MRRWKSQFDVVAASTVTVGGVADRPALAAEEAPATYTKKAVAVYEAPGDSHARSLRYALQAMGRFHVLPVTAGSGEGIPGFLSKVRGASQAAGLAGTPAYVFVPRYSLGRITLGELETNRSADKSTGKLTTTVTSSLKCPLRANVDVYEVASGRLIKQMAFQPTLEQHYQYSFSNETSEAAQNARQREFRDRLQHDIRRTPEDLFGQKAESEMSSLMSGSVIAIVRSMEQFTLAVGVTGWDAKSDRINFGLGRDLKVRVDDSFKVFQNGKEIGYVKVRQVGPNSSSAQPVFMDAALRIGDRVVEYPKANWWNTFKGGVIWMGAPAAVGGYTGDVDIGSWFDFPEFFLTYHLAGLSNGITGGSMGELGLTKKFFWRRWGLAVGPRAGFTWIKGVSNDAMAPGVSLTSTLSCYLTPDIVWSTDLGLAAYTPADPTRMGFTQAMPKNISPFGPMVTTGLTFVF